MDDFFISVPVNDKDNMCIAPLSGADLADCGFESEDGFGLFLYQTFPSDPTGGIEVLAKMASRDAAERLASVLEAARRASGINRPVERAPSYE